ncbi:MAG: protein-(glutamine-N5) methyltransferase, release factor-specific [Chloroflexi bacterium UTCFX4]|jgi:release factor glutamine methyltransferase|nr:MAG: protein-(glutamine-N5) methyltransferase, release factor-specific [Chloroflexi bacterium UTCFX4]
MLITSPETIQEVLVSAVRAIGARNGYASARLEAEILLAHTLNISRALLLARLGDAIAGKDAAQFAGMVARRAQGEPLAYIVGHQEFYGLDFYVDRRVLIPRHETEHVVESALLAIKKIPHPEPIIVDVGTGSGAIALALARNTSRTKIIATDISPDALAVAKLNAARLHLTERVEFCQTDLLDGIATPIDILTANLPYIPLEREAQLPREIRRYEPRLALVAGLDGLSVIRRLLKQLESHMARASFIFLEISEEQGDAARKLVNVLLPHARVEIHRDLEGLDRVVEIKIGRG